MIGHGELLGIGSLKLNRSETAGSSCGAKTASSHFN